MWQRIIALDDVDLSNFGTMETKQKLHVAAVAKGLSTFGSGLLVGEDVNVDLCR